MHPGVYYLADGLIGYGAGMGLVNETDRCLILSTEVDEDGGMWANIIRLKYTERLPCSQVVHLREALS